MALRYYISSEEAPFFINNKMGYSDRIPTNGTYKVGDFIISSTQANGIFGWVCTVAGTPGTWIEIGSGNSGGSSTTPIELVGLSNTVEFDDVRSSIEIGIPEFNKENDILEVHYNGLLLAEGIHYSLNYNGTAIENIEGQWNASGYPDQQMFFKVIKVKNAGNGSLVQLRNTVDISGNVFEVNTGISDYAYRSDIMEVHLNGVLLIEGIDYNYSDGKIVKIDKSEGWNPHSVEGQKMFFKVLKNLGDTTGIVTKTISVSSSTTISSPASEVEIGIVEFNKDTDTLMAYVNSTFMVEGVDYEINSTGSKIISKNGNWNEEGIDGYTFAFVVLKEIEVNMNGSVGGSLDPVVMDKINTIGDVSLLETENKVDLVSAINEVNKSVKDNVDLINQAISKAEAFQSGNNVKHGLVEALIAKGIDVSTSNSFSELINKIGEIRINKLPEWYNNRNNFWIQASNMNNSRRTPGSAVVDNKIYCIGGYLTGTGTNLILSVNECFDPITGSWETKADMTTARTNLTASASDNKIYCIGGGGNAGRSNKNECYDPFTDTWSTKTDMTTARDALTSSTVDNKIYCIGGNTGSKSNKNECYDPFTDTWSTKTDMTTARYFLTSSNVNNKIYCMGGHLTSSSSTDANECYDPITDTWSTRTSMTSKRCYLTSSSVNNKIYCIGGFDSPTSSTPTTKNEYYNPSNDEWVSSNVKTPIEKFGATSVVLSGHIYFIGGSIYNVSSTEVSNNTTYCFIP